VTFIQIFILILIFLWKFSPKKQELWIGLARIRRHVLAGFLFIYLFYCLTCLVMVYYGIFLRMLGNEATSEKLKNKSLLKPHLNILNLKYFLVIACEYHGKKKLLKNQKIKKEEGRCVKKKHITIFETVTPAHKWQEVTVAECALKLHFKKPSSQLFTNHFDYTFFVVWINALECPTSMLMTSDEQLVVICQNSDHYWKENF